MKNLELNEYGVASLNETEVKEINGGGLIIRFENSTKDIYNSNNPKGERWFWQRDY